MLRDISRRRGVHLSTVVAEALATHLGEMLPAGCPERDVPASPSQPMTVSEAVVAFHQALRIDDAGKDEVACSWLEYRAAEASGNVIPLRGQAKRAGG